MALLLQPVSPTPSNTGSPIKIVPKRHWEEHKDSAVLRSSTTRRRKRVPLSNQSTTSNTSRHIRQRQCKGCIGILLIVNIMHNTVQIVDGEGCTLKHRQLEKTALVTTLSSCLNRVWIGSSASNCWTILQGRQDKASQRSQDAMIDHEMIVRSFSWYQASDLQHWKQSEGASQRSSVNQTLPPYNIHQTEQTKHQTEQTKHQTERTKRQTERTKHQTERTKRQTERTKRQTERTKRQTESMFCRLIPEPNNESAILWPAIFSRSLELFVYNNRSTFVGLNCVTADPHSLVYTVWEQIHIS